MWSYHRPWLRLRMRARPSPGGPRSPGRPRRRPARAAGRSHTSARTICRRTRARRTCRGPGSPPDRRRAATCARTRGAPEFCEGSPPLVVDVTARVVDVHVANAEVGGPAAPSRRRLGFGPSTAPREAQRRGRQPAPPWPPAEDGSPRPTRAPTRRRSPSRSPWRRSRASGRGPRRKARGVRPRVG